MELTRETYRFQDYYWPFRRFGQ